MTEESKTGRPDTEVTRAESKVEQLASPHAGAPTAGRTDQWSSRRAELRKQKRRAHRRRINAANRPG